MLGALLTAILLGTLAFVVVKVVLLTMAWLKKKITEKLKNNESAIPNNGLIYIKEILDRAPEISLEDFGSQVEENDLLMLGIKEDGTLDEKVDIIRAEKIDDEVVAFMKKQGGTIKVSAGG